MLVNNAGSLWAASYDTYPDAAWTKMLTLNLQRVFTLTQLLTPLLEAGAVAGSGSARGAGAGAGAVFEDPAPVIHIGSIDALRVSSFATFAYTASKAGLHHLSRTLALELGPRGITSNTLACGPFDTRMLAAALESAGDMIRGANPLGRIGRPEDVAGACLWLSSKAGCVFFSCCPTLSFFLRLYVFQLTNTPCENHPAHTLTVPPSPSTVATRW